MRRWKGKATDAKILDDNKVRLLVYPSPSTTDEVVDQILTDMEFGLLTSDQISKLSMLHGRINGIWKAGRRYLSIRLWDRRTRPPSDASVTY